MSPAGGLRGSYLRFAGLGLGVMVLLVAAGWIPTRRWGGAEALEAMIAGCAISLVASLVGGLVVALGGRSGSPPVVLALGAMGLRLFVVVALGLTAALAGDLARRPLLIWLAVSYVALLAVDTRFALEPARAAGEE